MSGASNCRYGRVGRRRRPPRPDARCCTTGGSRDRRRSFWTIWQSAGWRGRDRLERWYRNTRISGRQGRLWIGRRPADTLVKAAACETTSASSSASTPPLAWPPKAGTPSTTPPTLPSMGVCPHAGRRCHPAGPGQLAYVIPAAPCTAAAIVRRSRDSAPSKGRTGAGHGGSPTRLLSRQEAHRLHRGAVPRGRRRRLPRGRSGSRRRRPCHVRLLLLRGASPRADARCHCHAEGKPVSPST